ncbi:Oligopeptide transport ATP-binding protein OppD [[Clostridium] ultunense Esp]|uniref:Oligopeptide ABC transporter (ATP-binding protein) n=1 Tax=[Clostridium] ultunense Esp TaxID=1288971 RepID=M1ZE81_9FIRM|nr:ABC transporter ATP-binding protein [Schnuerera ultunensis]CCQ96961.1 Oligopeptide transport ATP-binding protein OppD [[Clostridium] ultunense Esp]SHD76483.1 oligopeptide ABC transporter (ATP-binding protein) [[Clostridium] ultunense Esp]
MILEVKDLTVEFQIGKNFLTAVNNVNFGLGQQDSLGLVGESGCGKSTTGYALMNLLPKNGRISNGKVLINGVDIVTASDAEVRSIRWKEISMIFQNAMTALNPVQKIGDQIVNALLEHETISRSEAIDRASYFFEKVGISSSRLMQYPHEFSGGMKQRAVIALALICYPKILIADEPTTALDVVAQRQVIELLIDLQKELNLSMILISHDISAVAEACEKIAVMYGGEIMEIGPTRDVLIRNNHPYTNALVGSFPSLHKPISKLTQIPGSPPNLADMPSGCSFYPRCTYAQNICLHEKPPMRSVRFNKLCKCHFAEELDFNQ